jgi:hypothetical protein
MLVKKVNMYLGYSCPIMGTNSFGMHTINLLHGATSIIRLAYVVCCKLLYYCCKLLRQKVNFIPRNRM